MKKILFIGLMIVGSLLSAQQICTTAPNGDIICTDDGQPANPVVIFD